MTKATKVNKEPVYEGLIGDISESSLQTEIDLMTEKYYEYLVLPLNSAKIVNYDIVSFYKAEVIGVDTLLKNGGDFRPLIDGLPTLSPFQPKIGQRGLPKLFDAEELSKVYRYVVHGTEFDVWKSKSFDILLQIQIAQCKALTEYLNFLNGKIRVAETQIASNATFVKAFDWKGSVEKLEILYNELVGKDFIICESFDVFREGFSNEPLGDSTIIKWIHTGKNKSISKVSLLYLIQQLRYKKLVTSPKENNQTALLQKLFKDINGNDLKNFKQSKNNSAKESDQSAIDSIIMKVVAR